MTTLLLTGCYAQGYTKTLRALAPQLLRFHETCSKSLQWKHRHRAHRRGCLIACFAVAVETIQHEPVLVELRCWLFLVTPPTDLQHDRMNSVSVCEFQLILRSKFLLHSKGLRRLVTQSNQLRRRLLIAKQALLTRGMTHLGGRHALLNGR